MAFAKLTTARKEYTCNKSGKTIAKGDQYFKWSLNYGGRWTVRRAHKDHPPRPSELTTSSYYGQLGDLELDVDAAIDKGAAVGLSDFHNMFDELEELVGNLEGIGEEAQDSLDAMPESLQEGPTGELLQERVDWCEQTKSEIDDAIETAKHRWAEEPQTEELRDELLEEVRQSLDFSGGN